MYPAQIVAIAPRPAHSAPAAISACHRAIALVAREKNISTQLFVHRSRCQAETARARQLAMYLSHVVLGCTLGEIGTAFGRDRTTVSHACALIEDLRDDAAFDAEVTALELSLEQQGQREIGHA